MTKTEKVSFSSVSKRASMVIKRLPYDNGTVEDTDTGLMWTAKDNGGPIIWGEAKSYCSNYREGGYTDWRMPTQDELTGLYDPKVTNTRPPLSQVRKVEIDSLKLVKLYSGKGKIHKVRNVDRITFTRRRIDLGQVCSI